MQQAHDLMVRLPNAMVEKILNKTNTQFCHTPTTERRQTGGGGFPIFPGRVLTALYVLFLG